MTTGTYTARDLVDAAFRKLKVRAEDEPLSADMAETGLRQLDRMMKAFQNRGFCVWMTNSQTVTLTTDAEYTLDPVRPMRIVSARLVRDGIETPMQRMTREEYDSLPVKTSQGLPTTFYYDRQPEAARFYVWPVLASPNGEQVRITYEREVDDFRDLNATVNIPGEWWDAVVYNLAARLTDEFPEADVGRVVMRAEAELEYALGFDREESVFFGGEH